MADFVIRIPRVSVAVSEAELVELLVDNGQHVEEGTPIYVIATDKAEQEVEAGASGIVQWTAKAGGVYDIGVEIGVITRTSHRGGLRSVRRHAREIQ
jgi:pyruvate/2-oxoglutarate dehydrogenase complex dihydrolipoamide acyltransferase (E2) component